MNPGQMRHVITFQSVTKTPDTFRQAKPTWTDVLTCRAFVRPLSGSQAIVAQQQQSKITHSVTTRYNPDITPTAAWRILYVDGNVTRQLNIVSIISVDERHREWQIMAVEVPFTVSP